MRFPGVIAVLALCVPAAYSQTIAITGGEVHTVGPDGVLENATILVRDGRIAAVGEDVEVPDDARRIDAAGMLVTPGLFSPLGYIGLVEVGYSAGPVDSVQRGAQFTASFDVADAFNPRSTLVAVNRIEGITRALAMPSGEAPDEIGNFSHVVSGLAAVVNLSGSGESIDRRAAAMVVNLGEAGVPYAGSSRVSPWLVLKHALEAAREYRGRRDDYATGQHPSYAPSVSDLEAWQSVLDGETPLLAHVDRASDIERLVELGEEFELRVIIAGGTEAWLVADELAGAGFSVILAPANNLPSNFDRLNARGDAAAILAEAGVRISFADDEGHTHNARNITQSAGNAIVAGLGRDAALRAITLDPAVMYGVEDRIGSIEPGKEADLVIWPGDPFELTVYPQRVIVRGEEVPMRSRQTLLRDRYLEMPADRPPAWRTPATSQ